MDLLLVDGGGGQVPPSTPVIASDSLGDDEFSNMISDFQSWKKIRMIGSAAMASVYVAAGKDEAYKENGIF